MWMCCTTCAYCGSRHDGRAETILKLRQYEEGKHGRLATTLGYATFILLMYFYNVRTLSFEGKQGTFLLFLHPFDQAMFQTRATSKGTHRLRHLE